MTSTHLRSDPASPTPPAPPTPRGTWLGALALRIHFYAAVFVGPFLLVAALSGALYAMTPQLEKIIYADELTGTQAAAVPLEQQVRAAQDHLGTEALPAAVRPGPEGLTTRVMFADPELGESETRAIFVDPATAAVTGDLTAYGTSGSLPFRTWIDHLHRNLHLGEFGRLYSEVAASWLGIVAVAGVVLWVQRIRRTRKARGLLYPDTRASGRKRLVSLHSVIGIWLSLGFLFLAATGLTWSTYAGANVSELRAAIGWSTPSITTDLGADPAEPGSTDEHVDHGPPLAGGTEAAEDHSGHGEAGAPAGSGAAGRDGFDRSLAAARDADLTAGLIEVKPPAMEGMAWTVTEIDRSWPSQVDAVAVEPGSFTVMDKVVFDDYPFAAKLARWGIDAHMGVLVGVVNQIALTLVALGLAAMIVWGYAMWFRRRPMRSAEGKRAMAGRAPARGALRKAPAWAVVGVLAAAVLVGVFAPLLGITLLAFLVVDALVGHRRRSAGTPSPAGSGTGYST
ncbi:peptidase [Arthrobacter sp. RIT-PI-e]|uniref:PepSY-associated TM helix domain-containing protein n=1 Tax=Arthrobacter sp. RIT-PI-e TaxID=1681197 RepID=UPI0006763C48|nr:PepSY domain-containing protein [Arthrobacter sp. RIT-PI-e]KNC18403.1 peptidase [Arthrobacter sp. RIT-PI-e]